MIMEDKVIENALEKGAIEIESIAGQVPTRRVFKIDVGNIDLSEVEAFLDKVRTMTQQGVSLDHMQAALPQLTITEAEVEFKPISLLEDKAYWKDGERIPEEDFLQAAEKSKKPFEDYVNEDPIVHQAMQDMEVIRNILQWLKEDGFGLEVEVIYWALKEMKADPTLGIGDAMSLGFTEWDK